MYLYLYGAWCLYSIHPENGTLEWIISLSYWTWNARGSKNSVSLSDVEFRVLWCLLSRYNWLTFAAVAAATIYSYLIYILKHLLTPTPPRVERTLYYESVVEKARAWCWRTLLLCCWALTCCWQTNPIGRNWRHHFTTKKESLPNIDNLLCCNHRFGYLVAAQEQCPCGLWQQSKIHPHTLGWRWFDPCRRRSRWNLLEFVVYCFVDHTIGVIFERLLTSAINIHWHENVVNKSFTTDICEDV